MLLSSTSALNQPKDPGGNRSIPAIAVVMSIHEPDPDLLGRQIESLLGQSGIELSVFAVLDGPETQADGRILEMLADRRINIITPTVQNGIRVSFFTGLQAALTATSGEDWLYAFADQDDVWYRDKLRLLADRLAAEQSKLVNCDACVVRADGTLITASLHRYEARRPGETLLDHLLLNSVTGMTALFTADVAWLCVRLASGLRSAVLHDHVAAIAAAAIGRTTWMGEVLVDYVQHGGNSLGAVARSSESWAHRGFSRAGRQLYRKKSAALFDDRRSIVVNLHREGVDCGMLGEMFLVDAKPGRWRLIRLFMTAWIGLLMRGQLQRASLCARALNGALQRR